MAETKDSIRVVLADDHRMFVDAIRLVLSQEPRIEVVAVLDSGDALVEAVRHHRPDIALVDLTMPGPGAARIGETLARSAPDTRLVALTMHLDHGLATRLLNGGYAGYVVKDAALDELLVAIHAVMRSETYLSQALSRPARQGPGPLTQRETDCLRRAAEGHSNKAIASDLALSERTIKFHFENILRKLQAASRGEAVAIARRQGLL